MRVGDRDALAGQQLAHLTSLSITTLLAFPGLPFSRMIRSPPKKGRSGRNDESSRMLYVISRPVLAPDLVVVVAVAGRGVDEARARVVGHVVAGNRHVEVPLAIAPFGAAQGMGAG
jgi:hypothetical protein